MSDFRIVNVSRRGFLKGGSALALAVVLPGANSEAAGPLEVPPAPVDPLAFVRIGRDNTVTVISKHLEMGQGIYTGLSTLIAEELDASWSQIRVIGAPVDAKRYENLLLHAQGTGGSSSMPNAYLQMRRAGAAARAMLLSAAAKRWGVAADTLTVQDGVVRHRRTERSATFGQLAQSAALQPVPADVTLKDAKDFRYIGKSFPRVDSRAKVRGTARFTQDVKLPGMLTAVVAHPPRFGAKVKSFDATAARKVPGVRTVVQVANGVAIVADDFWSAKLGRDALKVEWDEADAFRLASADIMAQHRKLAQGPGAVAARIGDVDAALGKAARRIVAEYEFPYYAHATMEPLNCVAKVGKDGCEIWQATQFQVFDHALLQRDLGLPPDKVKLNVLYAGGSFGRRANPQSHYVRQAAQIAKAVGNETPVKLVWTREDDMTTGPYRAMFFHRIETGIDGAGNLVAWKHRIVGQSLLAGTPIEKILVRDGVDPLSVETSSDQPYSIANFYVDLHSPKLPVPVSWLRTSGGSHGAFVVETMIDEIAVTLGKDPLEFRRQLMAKGARHLAVLNLAAEKAGWGTPLAPGKAEEKRGRGIAVSYAHFGYAAQVVEVTVRPDNSYQVDRVVGAVDVGLVINPDIVRSQIEGNVGYGLSMFMKGAITFKDGRVEQSNFHDFPILRINEMPAVESHFVLSSEKPGGVGEAPLAPLGPALANALANATGKRLRSVPLRLA